MQTYYVIVVNGIPEQVTANWNRAKQAADELTTKHREARIVPCRSVEPEQEPEVLEHGPEV